MKKLIHTLVLPAFLAILFLQIMPVKAEVLVKHDFGIEKKPPSIILVSCKSELDKKKWCEQKLKNEIEATGARVILSSEIFDENINYTLKQMRQIIDQHNPDQWLSINDKHAPSYASGSFQKGGYSQTTMSGSVANIPVAGMATTYSPSFGVLGSYKIELNIDLIDIHTNKYLAQGGAVTYATALRKHYYKIAGDLVRQLKRDGFLWNGKKR